MYCRDRSNILGYDNSADSGSTTQDKITKSTGLLLQTAT